MSQLVMPGLEERCLGALTKDEEKGRGSGNLCKVTLAGLGADWLETGTVSSWEPRFLAFRSFWHRTTVHTETGRFR